MERLCGRERRLWPREEARREHRGLRCVIGLPSFVQMTITNRSQSFSDTRGPDQRGCCNAGGKGRLKTADFLLGVEV